MIRLILRLALLAPGILCAQTPNFISPSNAAIGTFATLAAAEAQYPASSLPTTGGPTIYVTGVGPYYWNGSAWVGLAEGSGSSANPSATIGLAAVNGTAETFMTSDSAPPLSQAIVPTWTGVHTFSAAPVFSAGAVVGAHYHFTGTAPAVSACGTSPSIDAHATDQSGTVTVGTVSAASCTVSFHTAYSIWVHCRVTAQTPLATFAYSYTVSAITVTATSLLTEVFDYDCDGS